VENRFCVHCGLFQLDVLEIITHTLPPPGVATRRKYCELPIYLVSALRKMVVAADKRDNEVPDAPDPRADEATETKPVPDQL
jgi:hypothetical protein